MKINTELQEVLNTPSVKDLIKMVRRNLALIEIAGEQHTTQAFSTAEDMRAAFMGELSKIDSSDLLGRIVEAKKDHVDLMGQNDIRAHDLKTLFEKVWVYSRLTNPTIELLEEVLS